MKYIGNYKSWLKDEWIDYVLKNDGKEMPKFEFLENDILGSVEKGERAEFCEYQKKYNEVGYKHDSLLYYIFEQDDLPFEITLPPFVNIGENQSYYWNLFKYKPGHILPMHSDRTTKFEKNCRRYWMSWLDYQEGHILIYNDQLIGPYVAGDTYMFTDPFATHGAANIGLSTRITFQITAYDE
jgi:hypothetical protein